MDSLLSNNSSNLLQIPEILLKRNILDDGQTQKHLIEKEEIVLLKILNKDGFITNNEQLSDFMVFMTRISKFEHRSLCLNILAKKISKECLISFVILSGLLILSKWLKLAEEEDCITEMRKIIYICKKLPFDAKAVKDAGIGKAIKKLTKYRSATKDSLSLNDDSSKLVLLWTEKLTNNLSEIPLDSNITINVNINPKPLTSTINNNTNNKNVINEIVKNESKDENEIVSDKAIENIKPLKLEIPSKINSNGNIRQTQIDTTAPSTTLPGVSPISPLKTAGNIPVPFGKATPTFGFTINKDKRSDMVEEAKKQLLLKEKAPTIITQPQPVTAVKKIDPNNNITLKSSLKRKTDSTTPSSSKRQKTRIQWKDEYGEPLKEVFTFEVEKIRTLVASYKSHKDLVKKERQLEKDVHLSKINDTMQKTTEWKTPNILQLSMDIMDTINLPIVSQEVEVQTNRLSSILESRYLDESLIPSDPDELPKTNENALYYKPSFDNIINIPWYSPGTEPNIMDAVTTASNATLDSSNDGSYSLPDCLKQLDPQILQLLVQDQTFVSFILNEDGTVNEEKVNILKSQLTNTYSSNYYNNPTDQMTYNNPYTPQFNNSFIPNSVYGTSIPNHQSGNSLYDVSWNTNTPGGFSAPIQSSLPIVQPISAIDKPNSKPPPKNKGTVACRFFNTPQGCQFGDKCSFKHVLNNENNLKSNSNVNNDLRSRGPSRRAHGNKR